MTRTTMLALFLYVCPFTTIAQLPSGAVALYPLDYNTINDVSGNGYNGTLTATTAVYNRFGGVSSATGFTAGTSTGTLPVGLVTALQNDFTIAYWFKTTMTAPSVAQWHGGSAMVDAEVCGSTADWGTALIDGGKVSMGIGNPDITIKSTSATYNDGAWHYVTATRSASAGVITLYVDGTQVATTSGTATTARTAPNLIGLGRNPCVSTGVYTGSLDDIIAYNRVLTSTEVSHLYTFYSGVPLPLKWVSFTARTRGDKVDLKWQTAAVSGNDHFEVQRSADADSFTTIGTLPEAGASDGASYSFTDASPPKGNDLYRIRQVDIDGRYSWSPTVEVHITPLSTGLYLQANPVSNAVTLINSQLQTIQRLQIADLSGRILVNRVCSSSANLISENVQWLRAGFYFLRVQSHQNATTIGFIKL